MILFINFAPISFMGGAERWIYETAKYTNKTEKTIVLSVCESLSNLYSRLVLNRKFEKRYKISEEYFKTICFSHFIPFTKNFQYLKRVFKDARRIYIKYEITEILITIYFGGFSSLHKTIAGIHSPFYYSAPIRFLDRLHNNLYLSNFSKFIMKNIYKIHVITMRDKNFLKNKFGLSNIMLVPNSVEVELSKNNINKKSAGLTVLFIGELSIRKGIDILIQVIKASPNNIHFDVAGNGPWEDKIINLCKDYSNCRYHGFLNQSELSKLYHNADVLFLPSRAESFPLVFHEAMAHGLLIVDSPYVTVGLPTYIESTPLKNNYTDYIQLLSKLRNKKFNRDKIVEYYKMNFSPKNVLRQTATMLFN